MACLSTHRRPAIGRPFPGVADGRAGPLPVITSRRVRALGLVSLICLAAAATGCESFSSYFRDPPTVVWVTSLDKVAGKWAGTARQVLPERRSLGEVHLSIQPDGDYRFADGTAPLGAGRLAIRSGRLVSDAKDRSTLVTLYGEKERWLGVDVTLKTGERYYTELRRAR